MMNIEHVYGDRNTGKTFEIIQNVNHRDQIGIITLDYRHKNRLEQSIEEFYGTKFNNVTVIYQYHELHGHHFNKIFIDEADSLNYNEWINHIIDSCTHDCEVKVYFLKRVRNFTTRILETKNDVKLSGDWLL